MFSPSIFPRKLAFHFLALENDQLTITLCNIPKFFVVKVEAKIIVDSGRKKVPLNAPKTPCSGTFFRRLIRVSRTCKVINCLTFYYLFLNALWKKRGCLCVSYPWIKTSHCLVVGLFTICLVKDPLKLASGVQNSICTPFTQINCTTVCQITICTRDCEQIIEWPLLNLDNAFVWIWSVSSDEIHTNAFYKFNKGHLIICSQNVCVLVRDNI